MLLLLPSACDFLPVSRHSHPSLPHPTRASPAWRQSLLLSWMQSLSFYTCSEFQKLTNRCLPTLDSNILSPSPCLSARVLSESWPPSSMPRKEMKTCEQIIKSWLWLNMWHKWIQVRSPGRNWPSSQWHVKEPPLGYGNTRLIQLFQFFGKSNPSMLCCYVLVHRFASHFAMLNSTNQMTWVGRLRHTVGWTCRLWLHHGNFCRNHAKTS